MKIRYRDTNKEYAKILYNAAAAFYYIIMVLVIGVGVPMLIAAIAPGLTFSTFMIFLIIGYMVGLFVIYKLAKIFKHIAYMILNKITK